MVLSHQGSILALLLLWVTEGDVSSIAKDTASASYFQKFLQ